jgi:hypothetical protein
METPMVRPGDESQSSATKVLNSRYSNADLNIVEEAGDELGQHLTHIILKNIQAPQKVQVTSASGLSFHQVPEITKDAESVEKLQRSNADFCGSVDVVKLPETTKHVP